MSKTTTARADGLDNPNVELRSTIMGLCFACPFDQGDPEGCIFHEIRKRPMAERFAWIMHLDDATKQTLLVKHEYCLSMKETTPANYHMEPFSTCVPD